MKRLIAAVSFSILAVPAFATPFEQTELDRQLPNISSNAPSTYVADSSAPFEQNELDRSLPSLGIDDVRYAAASGSTVSDIAIASDAGSPRASDHVGSPRASDHVGSPWASDHNVISPAQ